MIIGLTHPFHPLMDVKGRQSLVKVHFYSILPVKITLLLLLLAELYIYYDIYIYINLQVLMIYIYQNICHQHIT